MQSRSKIRFFAVVQSCGRPEIVYLWTKPEADPGFMKAVRENRVMTLAQEAGGRHHDYGIVGFVEDQNSAYLVFPKSLSAYRDRQVVGIKYDLIQIPAAVGRVVEPQAEPDLEHGTGSRRHRDRGRASAHRNGRAESAKQFRLTFRFTATTEVVKEVEAESKEEAVEKASGAVPTPDFSRAQVALKGVKVTQL